MNCYIKNAGIVDIAEKKVRRGSVLVQQGKIVSISEHSNPPTDAWIIDGEDCLLTAGWIDAHAHLYITHDAMSGLDRDAFLSSGVTYMLEAGTAGPGNFEDYLQSSVRGKTMPGKAYLNLAFMGALKEFGELADINTVDLNACEETIHRYSDEIIGVKLRIDSRVCTNPYKAMELAKTLGQRTHRPVIVHASRAKMSMADVLSFLDKGDIFAHSFADRLPGLLDENGTVKDSAVSARRRGVFFDLSHGNGNFSFSVAKKAIAQGFLPDAISTDLHKGSRDKVQSLSLTMSKMLSCGLDVWTVLRLVTLDAAKMLQISDKALDVAEGAPADITLFCVRKGQFLFADSDGMTNEGTSLIQPVCTILGDKVYVPSEM